MAEVQDYNFGYEHNYIGADIHTEVGNIDMMDNQEDNTDQDIGNMGQGAAANNHSWGCTMIFLLHYFFWGYIVFISTA